eukprot:CAMPEP_0194711052 /NCGR_PEP_ID=MMETSP0296-20130528/3451_1 /TAXON_ID=39354 /ORGANISM="Heterosigma akashiwo, Strain CCMP2393" /LENGTH=423 /DNA_ID=CAMNT_0039608945 /DNA_START=54 /DNA_END=1322 /DNA_ORIENTATION=+
MKQQLVYLLLSWLIGLGLAFIAPPRQCRPHDKNNNAVLVPTQSSQVSRTVIQMQTQSGKIEAYQPLYRVPSRGIVPNEYDFCLSAVDSAVSPNSDTKVLNALSNKVMKQILIGNVFTVEIENLRRKYEGENCDGDVDCLYRIKYLNCLSALAEGKQLNSLIRELTPTYQRAYDRILSVLQDNGCTLSVSKDDQEVSLVQRPPDADFCLSVYDFRSDEPSMTRDLNTIVNEVTRMLRFGTEEEINNLGIQLDADLQSFLERWGLGAGGQEAAFLRAVRALLAEDDPARAAAEGGRALTTGAYRNAYDRLAAWLFGELGAAGLGLQGVPASYRVTASFTSWERELRKTNTAKFWDPQPEYLWGEWSIGDDRSETSGRRPFEYVDDPENKLTVIKLKSDGSVHLEGGGGGDGGGGGKQERLQGLRW